MLSNAYFLAKFRFDTAKNEPAKILQKVYKICQSPASCGPRREVLDFVLEVRLRLVDALDGGPLGLRRVVLRALGGVREAGLRLPEVVGELLLPLIRKELDLR